MNRMKKFLLITGTFVTGIAAGMLLSPNSGKENLRKFRESSRDATDWAERKGKELATRGEELVSKGEELMARGEEKAQELSDRFKKEVKKHSS